MRDFPIKELRQVDVYFGGLLTNPSVHHMHESEVAVFVAAIIELHFTREANPHVVAWNEREPNRPNKTDGKTARVQSIHVGKFFDKARPYWWTTPGMHDTGNGAHILLGWDMERVWAHPDILAREAEKENAGGVISG